MKKKFLSLMMAAAVVATTSVSAFADTTIDRVTYPDKANITSSDESEKNAQVTINGNIQDDKGNDAPSTFKVTVPTAANFTVTKDGALVGPRLTIKNEGTQTVEVLAQDFTRGTGTINVIPENTITEDQKRQEAQQTLYRNSVSLKLVGEFDSAAQKNKVAYLGATNEENGVYEEAELGTSHKVSTGISLLKLAPGNESATGATEGVISLEGSAGPKKVESPVSDTFTLTLRIKKVKNN